MINYPCKISGILYANTKIAYRAVFQQGGKTSYFQLQRALLAGKTELHGHKIERINPHCEIAYDDGLVPVSFHNKPEVHKYGEPLLRYPFGERPIDRGINTYH